MPTGLFAYDVWMITFFETLNNSVDNAKLKLHKLNVG